MLNSDWIMEEMEMLHLRDENGDGKADIIERFGDYPNDGRFATEMKINNDYLYFSSERVIYRQKLKLPK